jgi:hypothetical protein
LIFKNKEQTGISGDVKFKVVLRSSVAVHRLGMYLED